MTDSVAIDFETAIIWKHLRLVLADAETCRVIVL